MESMADRLHGFATGDWKDQAGEGERRTRSVRCCRIVHSHSHFSMTSGRIASTRRSGNNGAPSCCHTGPESYPRSIYCRQDCAAAALLSLACSVESVATFSSSSSALHSLCHTYQNRLALIRSLRNEREALILKYPNLISFFLPLSSPQ